MYRGRPPPRGGYPPPFEGRGPPPSRPYPPPAYRDDRSRPRPPYHPGYNDYGHTDSFRRSPPHKRYPSPGAGSHRVGEYWAGGQPRERSPRGSVPLNHNLVITVGNELTGPAGSAPSRHHDRDYPPRPEYERSHSRGRSRGRSPDRSRAKSRGRSKSRAHSHSRSPDRSRAKSRGRSKSGSPERGRSKSRGRSKARSPNRSRAKSRGRSKSRPRSWSRSKSRSRSRSRSRGRSRGRSRARSKSRHRSRSVSSSSSSSSHSGHGSDQTSVKGFKELEMARRRKELEEMLSQPTKSILKKRNNAEDSPSVKASDSPCGLNSSNMSRVADQLLQAVKGMDSQTVASMLSELQSDPQMAHRSGLNAEIKEILSLLGGSAQGAGDQQKAVNDIDDEEKFLYGDSEDPKPAPEPAHHYGLNLYGDVTEETLYGDYPPQKPLMGQGYSCPAGATTHLQGPSTVGEGDMRYVSQPTINPGQTITVQVSNPAYPPGTEPLDENERQALEEYEKIQELLKTIGLDLGVAEISNMAARTKERLHGNKPPQKTPTHRRRYSSGSSDGSRRSRRRRSHSSSSSSSSRSRSHGRSGSWSSDEGHCRNASAPHRPLKDRDVKETKAEWSDAAAPSQMPESSVLPVHPSVPVPTYPPPQIHGMMPPNFPPPGFNQYGNFLPYVHQQWPPMYPPPNLNLPPPTATNDFPPSLPYKPAPESGFKGVVKSSEGEKASAKNRRVSEEQNNESQKQKVLEEREKLKQERDVRMKKKEYLMKELERLRKQQGELLRKKRRERDGHKDPLLQEISHLQEEVMSQISNLRKEHEAAEKKRNEIDKVALILGLSPSDRPLRTSKLPEHQEEEATPPLEKKKRESERSPDVAPSSTTTKTSVRASPVKQSVTAAAPAPPPDPFEYYDAGNHWCKNCNITCGSMFDFFTHLHSKTHRKTLDPYDRPWASTPTKLSKNMSEEKLTKPAKGSEFLVPVRGFFCLLCKEFYGDAICAEEHVTTHAHNEKYKKQMYENPLYEQRRNLDRQAGLASEATGKKRKHDDEEKDGKDKEDKFKLKKEKKDKEKKKEEDSVQTEEKSKVNKEEEEEKLKHDKKEEKSKTAKSLEEDKPSYSKKDDRYRYREEDRDRYSRRDEDDRYRFSREEEYRCRYRRDEDDRAKHGPRDDEDKYKSSKPSDVRSKYGKDQDEEKPRAERTAFKKPQSDKPAVNKSEQPPKPYEPPKIFCGPSPAMRAKLRKQSQDASKPAATSTTTSFGKFTWKKKENILAKEAQKVAAEFIKEDEAAVKEQPVSVEDSFAKSVAAAQKIAQKLADQTSEPASLASNSAGRGRIRPNLPAPAAVLRKATMMGRPAPLNTFLSIRPQSSTVLGSPPKPDLCDPLIKAQSAQKGLLDMKPTPPLARPGLMEAVSAQGPRPQLPAVPPFMVKPAPYEVRPAPPVYQPPEKSVSVPVPSEAKPVPAEIKGMPSQSATVPPATSRPSPAQPTMVKIVSDVAAPGVPESEQTRTVFVKPPPLILGDNVQKSEKHKSNLAAAKAQDLFGIFYSSISHSGPPSFAKPATDTRADKSIPSPLPAPQPQPAAQSQPLTEPHTQPNSSTSPPSPQKQPNPDIQIESVWSLQCSAGPDPGLAPPKHISQTNDPLLAHPQTTSAKLESTPLTESQPEHNPEQNTYPKPETNPDKAPEPEPKPGPKTRGKKTPPAPHPARQTRSQTRYQTRQQQSQSEPEPLLASGDSADSDPKGLNTSDPSSESQQEAGTTSEEDIQMAAITPETLGLPSDMTSLDFEYDFNFE